MSLKTRRRNLDYSPLTDSLERIWQGPDLVSSTPADWDSVGQQVTVSESDGLWPAVQAARSPRRGNLSAQERRVYEFSDLGNPFQTISESYEESHPYIVTEFGADNGYHGRYTGPLRTSNRQYTPSLNHGFWDWPTMAPEILWGYGAKAISKTVPTKSVASVATMLGELREGLPNLVGYELLRGRGGVARKSGSEYLNFQFGIRPLVDDIMKTAQAVVDAEKLLRQYERDSGRLVRRKTKLDNIETTENVSLGTTAAVGPTNTWFYRGNQYQGARSRRVDYKAEISFSGAYSYLLPSGFAARESMRNAYSKAEKLLGITPSAEVIWNLQPWSWLIDWQINLGDVFSALTAMSKDSLVMPYAYLMCQETIKKEYKLTGISLERQLSGPRTDVITEVFTTVKKQRIRASPYGFGLNTANFTSSQWAILGALGLSKAPGSLK